MFKIFPFFVWLFIALCLPLQASITVSISDSQAFIPEGTSAATEIAVIRLNVTASGQDENLATLTLTNSGPDIFFDPGGISKVSVFLNSDGNNDFSLTEDTFIVAETFTDEERGVISLDLNPDSGNNETILDGTSATYFVVYAVESDLDAEFVANGLELQTNLSLQTMTSSGGSFDLSSLGGSSFNMNIVGIYSLNVVDISPETILPGATDVPVMQIDFGVAGRDLENDFFIEIFNNQGNFSPTSNQKAGVERITLYKDSIASGQVLDQLLPAEFTSIERAAFTSLTNYKTTNGVVINSLVIAFDFGDDFPIASTSSVSVKLNAFSGTQFGTDFIVGQEPSVVDDVEIDVAGLTFLDMTSIVDTDISFGENQAIPILSFRLHANNTPITINRFLLSNVDPIDGTTRATYPYATSVNDSEGIQIIRVYEDSNFTGEFDPTVDTVIASVNTTTAGVISQPISFLPINNGLGLFIDEFIEDTNIKNRYPFNNERLFFVEYVSGTLPEATELLPLDVSGNRNLRASVFLDNIEATANINSEIVRLDLNGDVPASSVDPVAFVEFVINNTDIEAVASIAPANAVRGQINLPMLAVTLNFSSPISVASASITIANTVGNNEARFSGKNLGVSKIYIYKEPTGSGNQALDADDVLLASLIVPSTITGADSITLTGANLGTLSGSESFLIMYDIGFESPLNGTRARAQFNGLTNDDDESIELSGELPQPETPASVVILDQLLEITQVTVDTTDVSTVFNVTVTVENTSAAAVQLTQVLPRAYRNSVSGKDISGQFNTVYETSDPLPVTINAAESLTFSFTMTQELFDFSGIAMVDGYAEYTVAINSGIAAVNRYLTASGWEAASEIVDTITMPVVDFKGKVFPGYIDKVIIGSNANGSATSELIGFSNFENGTSLEPDSQMAIVFKNEGEGINEGSISLQLNGETVNRVNSVSTTGVATFEYNRDDGNILISNVGSSSGTVVLDVDDLEGKDLETTSISFLVSNSEVQLNDVYFFPNPYRIGSTDLQLGFDISRDSEVEVYIFNYRAQELFHETFSLSRGYNLISLGSNANFFESGIMLGRVIARDVDGNIDAATAKLAIY